MALTLPIPTLTIGQSIDLRCGPIAWSDNSPLIPSQVNSATFLTYRQDGSSLLTWDSQAKTWITGTPAKPESLYPLPPRKAPATWAATLMSIGQKDSSGNDKFSTDPSAGVPNYYVACTFDVTDPTGGNSTVVSPQSAAKAIVPPGAATASASVLVDPEPPKTANSIMLFVGQPPQLYLQLSLNPLFAQLSAAGALVQIDASGAIKLQAAASQQVNINADGGLWVNGKLVQVP